MELDLSSEEPPPESGSEPVPVQPELAESTPAEKTTEQLPPAVRRSAREKKFPDHFGWNASLVAKSEPSTMKEVMSTQEKDHWFIVMKASSDVGM